MGLRDVCLPIMVATATMACMPKKETAAKTAPVQCRLTIDEVAALDRAAAEQSIPVDRATIVAFILRKWLRENTPSKKQGR